MDLLRIVVASLAVWRLTHLLHTEDGPFDIFELSRRGLRRASLSGLADCFYCLSMWVAAPFALALASCWQDRLLLWPALSATAIFLNRLAESTMKAAYHEAPLIEENLPCPAAETPKDN